MGDFKILLDQFNLNLGENPFSLTYIEVGGMVILLFILVLIFAQFRRRYVDWSFKGAVFGIFIGFLVALILEGFLIIGGKTALTEVLGWKNPPAPVSLALDAGRTKLIQVLGINNQIPSSLAKENPTVQSAIEVLQSLSPSDIKKVKTIFCQP
jgi:hypothetical protein